MTDDALGEIAALRRRLAQLEGMLEQKGSGMYKSTTELTPEAIQQRLRAEAWAPEPDMETIARRLERDPDDPAVTPTMRISAALYRAGKAAAKAEGIDRPAGGLGLDTTGGHR